MLSLSRSVLAGVIFLPFLGSRDFWAPVEPRYAEIARVMFLKGQWIVPAVNGDLCLFQHLEYQADNEVDRAR
jgi:4-amino-4-deoxy-L-arabinose transferase-like glycosyltransferase